MRITEQTRTTLLLQGIDLHSSTLNTLNEELSTGKKVNQPSDDPVATGAIMRTNTYIADLNENISVVNSAQSFSQSASTALSDSTEHPLGCADGGRAGRQRHGIRPQTFRPWAAR